MSTQITLPKSAISSIQRAVLADSESRFQGLLEMLSESGIDVDTNEIRSFVVPKGEDFSKMFRAGKISEKRQRDPNAPKKAPSAYMIWLNENRESIKNSFEEKLVGKDKVTKVAKKAGVMWKALSDEEKQPFIDQAAEKSKEYKAAKELYEPSGVSVSKSGKVDFLSLPVDEAPEGWSGPFDGKFLWKYAAKRKFGEGKFKTFAEAVAAAEQLVENGDECSGITRDKTGYTLRLTSTLCDGKPDEGCISWVIGNATVVEPTKPKKKVMFKKSQKTKPEQKSKSKSKSKPEQKSKSEPKSEPTEGDKEEISVVEIEIDGEDYLHDENSGDIYNTETHQIIGKYIDGEFTLLED